MEIRKHFRNALSLGEAVDIEKLSKYPSAPSSAMTTRSHSYLKVYSASGKSRNSKRKLVRNSNWLTENKLSNLTETLRLIEAKTQKKNNTIYTQRKINYVKQTILQAKSDILDIKRDIGTYEYNFSSQYEVGITLDIMYKLSNNFHNNTLKLQEHYKESESFINKFHMDLSQLNFLKSTKFDNVLKPFSKETLNIREIKDQKKMYLRYQCCTCISGIYCLVQVLSNSIYSLVNAIALLPNGRSISSYVDSKLFVSTNCNLNFIFKSKIIEKLYFCIIDKEISLHWDLHCNITFYNFIIKPKAAPLDFCEVKIYELTDKTIRIKYGMTTTKVYLKDLGISDLTKKSLNVLKRKLTKNLTYDKDIKKLIWYDEIDFEATKGNFYFRPDKF